MEMKGREGEREGERGKRGEGLSSDMGPALLCCTMLSPNLSSLS